MAEPKTAQSADGEVFYKQLLSLSESTKRLSAGLYKLSADLSVLLLITLQSFPIPEHLPEVEKSLVEQMKELYILQGLENKVGLALETFGKLETLAEKENAVAIVRAKTETKLRDRVKLGIAHKDFPYNSPERTTEFLNSFGIDKIEKAQIAELKKAIDALNEIKGIEI